MGFLTPKVPKPPTPANPAIVADAQQTGASSANAAYSSLISTSAQGLQRKPNLQRTSLIGGS